ncbi:hypothetical protein D3C84_697890 [compost metagenome]
MPGIVQYHRQLIGVQPVAAANHEIADVAAQVLAVLALHPVGEVILKLWNPQADRRVFAGVAGVAAQPRVNPVVGRQLFARAGAGVGQAVVEQLVHDLQVGVVAFALADHLAVPFKAVAFQGLEDRGLGTGFFPGWVEVFHAQQPAAAGGACVEVGRQCRDQ